MSSFHECPHSERFHCSYIYIVVLTLSLMFYLCQNLNQWTLSNSLVHIKLHITQASSTHTRLTLLDDLASQVHTYSTYYKDAGEMIYVRLHEACVGVIETTLKACHACLNALHYCG